MPYENSPFPAAPPPAFMQTGNLQPTINEQEGVIGSENFGQEMVIENPFDAPPAPIEQSDIIPPFGGGIPPAEVTSPVQTAQSNQEKYKILDMFWLLNPKYIAKQVFNRNEAQFVILSYNINFGNLRISFFELTPKSIQGTVVFLSEMKRTVSGTIYPISSLNIVRKTKLDMMCIEQLFQDTGADWQHNRPMCQIQKNENQIRLTVKDPKLGQYFYDFIDVQKDAFLYACQFTYTKGYDLMAQNMLK